MLTFFPPSRSVKHGHASRNTNTVIAAWVLAAAAMTCTTVSAEPMLTFENTGSTSNVFVAGGTFTVDVTLDFDAADTGGMNVVGTTFDLAVESRDGLSSFPDLRLTEVVRPATSVLDFYVVPSGSDLNFTMNRNGSNAGDLGAATLFGDGASTGPIFLGSYTFELDPDAVPGEYEITLGGVASPIVTLFDLSEVDLVAPSAFQFTTVVPEPATASLLAALFACAWLRRTR